jgi:twitching motility two-component system response regulator PilG
MINSSDKLAYGETVRMNDQAVTNPSLSVHSPTTMSPAKALYEIVKRQASGQFTFGDFSNNSIFWKVYLGKGQLHFATSTIGQKERLFYIHQRYYPELEIPTLPAGQLDYKFICDYWQSGKLLWKSVRQLVFSMTQEALIQLLALPQSTLQVEPKIGLETLILSVGIQNAALPLQNSIQKWMKLRPEISSPFQRLSAKNMDLCIAALLPHVSANSDRQALYSLLGDNLCFYELAGKLRIDVLDLASLFQPLVKKGAATINPYCTAENDNRPVIACIDDSKTVQKNVRLIMESYGYKVLEITEPARALTTLVRQKPALVLLDISMPDISGYELCSMLRQSTLLREIPIVMLTGRDGMIDKIRARMVGATDYITKPFKPEQLLTVAQKLINFTNAEGY